MSDPVLTLIGKLQHGGFDPRETGPDTWQAKCPVHLGSRHNLSIKRGDAGKILVCCHHADEHGRGCDHKEIVQALGLSEADLFPPRDGQPTRVNGKSTGQGKPRAYPTPEEALGPMVRKFGKLSAFWVYRNADETEAFRVARFDRPEGGKEFRPIQLTSEGWALGDPPGKLALYGLTDLADADQVFVTEGEKTADLVRGLGLIATTSAHGAKSPHKTDWTPLAGKPVAILPDNDAPGEGYAKTVAEILLTLEPKPTVKVVRLPVLNKGDDVEQWLNDVVPDSWAPEQCRAELERLVDEAEPVAMNASEVDESEVTVERFLREPPEPRPIRAALRPVPKLDAKLIPEPLRAWLCDIADRVGCPLDFPAAAAVIALATVVGRKVAIRPKRHDDWVVIANLWGMIVARSGCLKSPAIQEVFRVLYRLEHEAREQHMLALREFNINLLISKAKAEAATAALRSAARKKKPDAEMHQLATETNAGGGGVEPTLRRYVLNDSTVEKLGVILGENTNGVLVFRDELPGWLRTLDKQGHEADRAFYLEAWNGGSSFTYDRIGRGTVFIQSTTVSVFGGIQPGPAASYIRAGTTGAGDDGMLGRFQIAVYPDNVGEWRNVDRWPDTAAKNRAFNVIRALDSLDPLAIGANIDDEDGAIPYLRFAPDAQELFDQWRTDLENLKLRADRESPCMESHLAKFRSLMPSLALLFHLVDVADGKADGPVSLGAASLAAAWCDYLEEHARRIYQSGFDGDVEPAQRLAERITQSLTSPFTARQVVQKGWSKLDSTEAVERAVAVLEEHGYLYQEEVPAGPAGGRPATRFHINPRVQGGDEL